MTPLRGEIITWLDSRLRGNDGIGSSPSGQFHHPLHCLYHRAHLLKLFSPDEHGDFGEQMRATHRHQTMPRLALRPHRLLQCGMTQPGRVAICIQTIRIAHYRPSNFSLRSSCTGLSPNHIFSSAVLNAAPAIVPLSTLFTLICVPRVD